MVDMDVGREGEQRLARLDANRVRKPGEPHPGIDEQVAVAAR